MNVITDALARPYVQAMARLVYGFSELADRLGVSKQRAYALVQRADFPEPADILSTGRVWAKTDVETWIKKHRPHLESDD